jgi:hypothetical protein
VSHALIRVLGCVGWFPQGASPLLPKPFLGLPHKRKYMWNCTLTNPNCSAGWRNGGLPHSSVVVATVRSSIYCWASYTAALRQSLATCQSAQQATQVRSTRLEVTGGM